MTSSWPYGIGRPFQCNAGFTCVGYANLFSFKLLAVLVLLESGGLEAEPYPNANYGTVV
jgi:hypothetical protein